MSIIDEKIIGVAKTIKEAIEVTLNPYSSPKDRQNAIQVKYYNVLFFCFQVFQVSFGES